MLVELEESTEGDGDESVVSAAATPFPMATAVPTPNATARPPTRPIWLAGPMSGPFKRNPGPVDNRY